MIDEENIKDCHNCGHAPFIETEKAKIYCPACGLSAGYKLNPHALPAPLKLREMLINLWNDLPHRKIKG